MLCVENKLFKLLFRMGAWDVDLRTYMFEIKALLALRELEFVNLNDVC